jgi:hypothetical protein
MLDRKTQRVPAFQRFELAIARVAGTHAHCLDQIIAAEETCDRDV